MRSSLGVSGENDFKKRKYPVCSKKKVLVDVWGQRSDWEDWLEIIETQQRGVYASTKTVPRTHCRASLESGY